MSLNYVLLNVTFTLAPPFIPIYSTPLTLAYTGKVNIPPPTIIGSPEKTHCPPLATISTFTCLNFAGLAGDICVYFSALDAIAEGFETFLMEDAVRSIEPEKFKQVKVDIVAKGGRVINSNDVKMPTALS